jgi:hypothetical protein
MECSVSTDCYMQCYKAVPALCVHLIKRTPSHGPGRLHVLRALDAIVGGSLNKHGTNDKYGELICSSSHVLLF